MSEAQTTQIELTMNQAKDLISFAESLERLHKNRDFKKIFSEGYFKDEALRLVGLKADPNMQTPERQEQILRDIDAIGSLQQYFRTVYQRAAWAERAIQDGQEALEEIQNEGTVH